MQSARIICCLDVDQGRVVKGVTYLDLRDAGDPVELACAYSAAGVDELVLLDITASSQEREITIDVVRRAAEVVFIPLTVGGGVRSAADARRLLRAGADKISVNSAAVANPALLSELAGEFGSQCVVLAIDVRRRPGPDGGDAGFEVVTHGGRRATGIDALSWAESAAALGAGELLVTSMDKDGTQSGYDLELLRSVADRTCLPVVASGGAGTLEHLAQGWLTGRADGLLAASIFHFGRHSVGEAREYLSSRGVPVRPVRISAGPPRDGCSNEAGASAPWGTVAP